MHLGDGVVFFRQQSGGPEQIVDLPEQIPGIVDAADLDEGFDEPRRADVEPALESGQRKGGAIAWGVGEAPTLVLAMVVAWQWVSSDRRETTRLDRRADRDGDAELEAYNRHLAGLGRRDAED